MSFFAVSVNNMVLKPQRHQYNCGIVKKSAVEKHPK
jgi:hypothetical protein